MSQLVTKTLVSGTLGFGVSAIALGVFAAALASA